MSESESPEGPQWFRVFFLTLEFILSIASRSRVRFCEICRLGSLYMVVIVFVWDLLKVFGCVSISICASRLELKVLPAVKK